MTGKAGDSQRLGQLLLPGLASAFAAYYLYDVWGERAETMLYGLLIGTLVIALSTVSLLSRLFSMRRGGDHRAGSPFDFNAAVAAIRENGRPIFLFGALLLFAILQPWIGFTLAVAFFLGAALWALGTRQPLIWLSLTMGLTLSAHLIFFHLLNVPLPRGPLF